MHGWEAEAVLGSARETVCCFSLLFPEMAHSHSSPGLDTAVSTKVLYFTDRSLTPFLINIPKRWGWKHFTLGLNNSTVYLLVVVCTTSSELPSRVRPAHWECSGAPVLVHLQFFFPCGPVATFSFTRDFENWQARRSDTAGLQGRCGQTRQFQIPLQSPRPGVWHSERGGRPASKIIGIYFFMFIIALASH